MSDTSALPKRMPQTKSSRSRVRHVATPAATSSLIY